LMERQRFLDVVQAEGKRKLLDVGAGPGVHATFFRENGLTVTCVDLSSEMIKRCREKGLTAFEMNFLNLNFPENSFDAVFAMNSLLHVPRNDLAAALESIKRLLPPAGLFYWGQYGGKDHEGVWESDHYEPKRFFSFLTDKDIERTAREFFRVISFKQIEVEDEREISFQSLLLSKM
ncbi:MAG: class I SAM-dependent methyltransferase, partial [bacterium]|nr:class I SAM-dependent methyltransferase [bacterium]